MCFQNFFLQNTQIVEAFCVPLQLTFFSLQKYDKNSPVSLHHWEKTTQHYLAMICGL